MAKTARYRGEKDVVDADSIDNIEKQLNYLHKMFNRLMRYLGIGAKMSGLDGTEEELRDLLEQCQHDLKKTKGELATIKKRRAQDRQTWKEYVWGGQSAVPKRKKTKAKKKSKRSRGLARSKNANRKVNGKRTRKAPVWAAKSVPVGTVMRGRGGDYVSVVVKGGVRRWVKA